MASTRGRHQIDTQDYAEHGLYLRTEEKTICCTHSEAVESPVDARGAVK